MNSIYKSLSATILFILSTFSLLSQPLMQQAATAFKQKDYETAIDLYTQAINQGTMQGNPYLWRGLSYFYSGDGASALEDLKFYIESDKNNPDVYNIIGLIYYEQGNNSEAKYYYDQAINADPNFAQAYINRGMSWLGLTTPTLARKDYDKAIKLEPRNPFAYFQRAKLNRKEGKLQEALSDIKQSESLGKRDAATYHVWGDILYCSKQYDAAIAKYSQGLKLDPNNIELLNSRAVAYNRVGKKELAAKDLQELEEISGIDIAGESQKYKSIASAKDVMKFRIPEDWVVKEKRDKKGEIVIHAFPEKYKQDPSISPVGVKFIYYTDLESNFKGKEPMDIVKDFEAETKFQGFNMHYYGIQKRQYKKYGGVDFALYTIKSQNRPSDKPEMLLKTITNLDDTILIGYMYSLETQYPYLSVVYENILKSIDFSENEYLRRSR